VGGNRELDRRESGKIRGNGGGVTSNADRFEALEKRKESVKGREPATGKLKEATEYSQRKIGKW